MERRLCFQHEAETNEPAVGLAALPDTIENTTQEKRQKKMTEIEEALTVSSLAHIAEDPEKAIREWEDSFIKQLSETTATFQKDTALSDALTAMQKLEQTKPDSSIATNIITMIEELRKPMPTEGTSHRYGSEKGVNFKAIERDKQFLKSIMRKGNPEEQVAFGRVYGALVYLERQDRHFAGEQIRKNKNNSKIDKLATQVGQTSLTLILGLAGLAVGGKMIIGSLFMKQKVGGSSILALLLCFGGVAFVANPRIRRQFFGSVPDNVVEDLKATLQNPHFQKLCRGYGITGEKWSGVMGNIMSHPKETRALANTMMPGHSRPSDEDMEVMINEYIGQIGVEGEQEKTLRKMIADHGQFANLAHILARTVTTDAQKVIMDYIAMGSSRYEDAAIAMAKKMNNALPASEQS